MAIKDPIPKSSLAEQEIEKAKEQFDSFENEVKSLNMDNLNTAPIQQMEPILKLAQSEIAKLPDNYLKPNRRVSCVKPFNEKFRSSYEFAKEYVRFTFKNIELIGESLTLWTKPFRGIPAEEWIVPANTPVWGPRYLAEQITRKNYHILEMKEKDSIGSDQVGTYQGRIVAKTTVQRLVAEPVSDRKSIFMGSTKF